MNKSNFGLISFICGILSILSGFSGAWYSLIFSGIGIFFAIKQNKLHSNKLSKAGVTMSIIGITLLWLVRSGWVLVIYVLLMKGWNILTMNVWPD